MRALELAQSSGQLCERYLCVRTAVCGGEAHAAMSVQMRLKASSSAAIISFRDR